MSRGDHAESGVADGFRRLDLPDQLAKVAESCERRAGLYEKKRARAMAATKALQVEQNKLKRDKWQAYAISVRAGVAWIEAHL
jgi:hypothetical protein